MTVSSVVVAGRRKAYRRCMRKLNVSWLFSLEWVLEEVAEGPRTEDSRDVRDYRMQAATF